MKAKPTRQEFQLELERMVQTLRDEITSGAYAPGECLPSEQAQAKRFGLSNKSVRKGLELLVEEGLIEKIPKVGSRVLAPKQRVRLTLGHYLKDISNLDLPALLADFQRRHSWIDVTPIPFTAHAGVDGDGDRIKRYDLIMMNNEHFGYLAEADQHRLLLPLEEKPGIYPLLSDCFRREGLLYARPLIFSPVVLCYNKRHFRESRLPEPDGSWRWDDLVRSATRLTGGNRFGFCFYLANVNRWPLFFLQSGERFQKQGGQYAAVQDGPLMRGIWQCKQLIRNSDMFPLFISDNDADIVSMFLEGKLSMVLNTYMGMNEWRQAGLEFDISPVPYISRPMTLTIAEGVGINRATPHPEAALLLADYLAGEQSQSHIRNYTLSLPSLQRISDGPRPKGVVSPERYMLYREMMFALYTHDELGVPWSKTKRFAYLLKAYWANLIDEQELCERINSELAEP